MNKSKSCGNLKKLSTGSKNKMTINNQIRGGN